MDAEVVYLFRHAVLRDALYDLQLPGDRAELHALALEIIEMVAGGAPNPPAHDADFSRPLARHGTDAFVQDLEHHAAGALAGLGQDDPRMDPLRKSELAYLCRAAPLVYERYRLDDARRILERIRTHPCAAPAQRIRARLLAGDLELATGETAEALACADAALAEATAGTFQAMAALAHRLRGYCMWRGGRREDARAEFEQALAQAQSAGSTLDEGRALINLASLQTELEPGLWPRAEALIEQGLAKLRACGERRDEGRALANLARLYHREQRPGDSERTAREALSILAETHDLRSQGQVHGNLAILYRNVGRYAEAETEYRRGIELSRLVGDSRSEAIAQANFGLMLLDVGRDPDAMAALTQAQAMHRDLGNFGSLADALAFIGSIHTTAGRMEDARNVLGEALDIAVKHGLRDSEGRARGAIASLTYAGKGPQVAVREMRAAVELLRAAGDRRYVAFHLCELAVWLIELGEIEQARACWLEGASATKQDGYISQFVVLAARMTKACADRSMPPLTPHE